MSPYYFRLWCVGLVFIGMEQLFNYFLYVLGIICGLFVIKELIMNILFEIEWYVDWNDKDEDGNYKMKRKYTKR
jgi:hypothetical protein